MAVAHAAADAAERIDAIRDRLRGLLDRAEALGLVVDAEASRVDMGRHPVGGPVDGLLNALALQHELDALLDDADAVDDELATAIDMADGDAPIPILSARPQDAEAQLQNQIDAFTAVFGRKPSSGRTGRLRPPSIHTRTAGSARAAPPTSWWAGSSRCRGKASCG